MITEDLVGILKQVEAPWVKSVSLAASLLGLGAKAYGLLQAWLKERAADRRRTKSLQQAGDLASILEKLEKLDPHATPQVGRLRAAVLLELDGLADKVMATYPAPPAPLTVPYRATWRRWLLAYIPRRRLAIVPQLFFYFFAYCTVGAPFFLNGDPAFPTAADIAQFSFLVFVFALIFRAWSAATEYAGQPLDRPLWQRLTLFYTPNRKAAWAAHGVYWVLGTILAFGSLGVFAEFLETGKLDRDALLGMLLVSVVLIACQQWARLYDGPPAIIEQPAPPPLPEPAAAKAAGA